MPIHRPAPEFDRPVDRGRGPRDRHQGHRPARALRQGRQGGPVRRRRRGQDRHHHGADQQHRQEHGGYSVFAGVGERTREGNDLWHEMSRVQGRTASTVLDKAALVYGQMNEPPGARARVGLGLTCRRVLPRRGRPGRAALHRQHLPLSPRRAPRCPRCWAASRRRWATSRPWPRRWASCRSGSPPPRRARSPRCRPSTCPPTT